jgi:hypothetical protein
MKRLAKLIVPIALALLAVAAILLIGRSSHNAAPPTAYAFDSLYEVRRGESTVNEDIIAAQEHVESRYHPLEASAGPTSTKCIAGPPPPVAHRLVCTVVDEEHLLYKHAKVTLTFRWHPTVKIDPATGALQVRIGRPSEGRSVTVP